MYLGYHRRVSPRSLLLSLACTLPCACAAKLPSPAPLCGTWSDGAGTTERWWIDGRDLHGEGIVRDHDGHETHEQLALIAGRRGHAYVARPGGATPVEFEPIDPMKLRYGPPPPAAVQSWMWANYNHDYPQEIRYVLLTDDRLHAEIIGPGDDEGRSLGRAHGWTLERVAACGEQEPQP